MIQNWTVEETLRHARHDFMNQLQLVKGNLDLDRVNTAKKIIDNIVLEAQKQSHLSALKSPQFTQWLLTYNWASHAIQLEYELLELEMSTLIKVDDYFPWFSSFFQQLEENVELLGENHADLDISLEKEECRFILDFQGIIKDKNKMSDWLKQNTGGKGVQLLVDTFTTHEILLRFIVKSS
ncbi:Spo0B C-terminal domain-containing protein [Bacillus sp. 2205SS5-2]|uniref:Spo0B C-terminal domain-containing protein n=1 Tax=Bacillus sp. 2205SS5-2 TaxID=3109031 RepID=UPI0030074FCE